MLISWQVAHSSQYGQPGPLAYKVDTLIVNRRIEEAGRPIPRIIQLGSLRDICRELGISEGRNRDEIRKALYQNASAFITAKLRYNSADGRQKSLETGFTRYTVVLTGEELPDGRKADAVYLVLNDVFMQVINNAQTRPLDYDYLHDLPPASQRFYELVSFQMYAALKHGRPRAKLAYSEFCRHAPLTRFAKWDQVRPQMARIHRPHLKSGYIGHVGFEQTTDQEGHPDWLMHYTPGPKAHAEYRAFTKRGAPQVLEIEEPSPALPLPLSPPPEPSPLAQELITRGVTASTARELVAAYAEEQIRRQIEQTDWLKKKTPTKITNLGAYLAQAIREDFASPPGFESQADREKRRAAEETQRRREQEEARRRQAEEARERAEQARILDYWHALGPAEQRRLEAEALEQADASTAQSYRELQATGNPLARSVLRCIREAHIRKLLGLAPPDAPAQ
ncbi:MAG TPA: hypothetical protein VKP69_34375 [Isosphaeraceae bacterium]|nr:hypothetical protein [Isosphaeraceae bacterium]